MIQYLRDVFGFCVASTMHLLGEVMFLAVASIVLLCQFVCLLVATLEPSTTTKPTLATSTSTHEKQQSGTSTITAAQGHPHQGPSCQTTAAQQAPLHLTPTTTQDGSKPADGVNISDNFGKPTKEKAEKERQRQQKEDRIYAEKLQAEFDKESKAHAEKQMMNSKHGKAWKFVQAVVDLHKSIEQSQAIPAGSGISTVATDDLVWLVGRMLVKQEEFKSLNNCTVVDLGYHYTKEDNMKRIRTDGLLTLKERAMRNIHCKHNGSSFGDGIYTCDDPLKYRNQAFGPVGLLVARLKGATSTSVSDVTYASGPLVVLRSSAQCVPLIQFSCDPGSLITQYHTLLNSLIDRFFNDEKVVPTLPVQDSQIVRAQKVVPAALPRPFVPVARQRNPPQVNAAQPAAPSPPIGVPSVDKTIRYIAPETLNRDVHDFINAIPANSAPSTSDCAICLHPLKYYEAVEIKACQHNFHYSCITAALAHSSRCPLCNATVIEPRGKMPSGEMSIKMNPLISCGGFAGAGTIEIRYFIPSDRQKSYHDNPGVGFGGTDRTAYLPHNDEGRRLLKRLEFAFLHGLTFMVGTSLTSGKPNVVTWASIHHKTVVLGGAHGYPDPGYFFNCNDELDALGVPSADLL